MLTPLFAGGGMTMLLMVVAAMLIFSFLIQRPLKKQQAEAERLRSTLGEGSRVMLTSGLFGTVTHVGDQQLIVELAPGVEVTALKQSVAKVVQPEDEEFEFSDGTEQVGDLEPAPGEDREQGLDLAREQELGLTREQELDEPGSDAAAMEGAAPGTGEGLGMPTSAVEDPSREPRTH